MANGMLMQKMKSMGNIQRWTNDYFVSTKHIYMFHLWYRDDTALANSF